MLWKELEITGLLRLVSDNLVVFLSFFTPGLPIIPFTQLKQMPTEPVKFVEFSKPN
ncbi:MAG: hypothetical protein ACI8R4_003454 [Paracoccaceae bacterium]|jgi:hypothetical protein